MTKTQFPVSKLRNITTPFYFYDKELLCNTLETLRNEASKYGFCEHYAIKANANPTILKTIASYGFGADCVSGGEVRAALEAGFAPEKIVFAGVGKADWEIELGLDNNIFCFNVESLPELQLINEFAAKRGKTAQIEIRVNPDVDAHTHAKITTGRQENKFGINLGQLTGVIAEAKKLSNIRIIGLHFHIGSQITEMEVFETLCKKVNSIVADTEAATGIKFDNINFGGGLGIDYQAPDANPVADYASYFAVFAKNLPAGNTKQIHFELGRAVVAQCGSLICKVLYVKEGEIKKFAILDGGMTDLIRPAMYDSYHFIENITSDEAVEKYDVVGPICESSDVFGKDRELNRTKRGDLIALRSAGAYGEVMASRYNLRELPKGFFSDEL